MGFARRLRPGRSSSIEGAVEAAKQCVRTSTVPDLLRRGTGVGYAAAMRARLPSNLRTSDPQSVTFVELFFDLVFVFAITQLTALTAHDLTPDGILRSILLGWLIWWAWTQFTWTLNPADATHTT